MIKYDKFNSLLFNAKNNSFNSISIDSTAKMPLQADEMLPSMGHSEHPSILFGK